VEGEVEAGARVSATRSMVLNVLTPSPMIHITERSEEHQVDLKFGGLNPGEYIYYSRIKFYYHGKS
jgi:hypothetical protein